MLGNEQMQALLIMCVSNMCRFSFVIKSKQCAFIISFDCKIQLGIVTCKSINTAKVKLGVMVTFFILNMMSVTMEGHMSLL